MAVHPLALDGARLAVVIDGGRWLISWHAPDDQPAGQPHGATGICRTFSGEVLLVSSDGDSWGFPGGRSARRESFRDTLDRELEEEACAGVLHARLIGWGRGECLSGPDEGTVLVRSNWAATVELHKWWPRHEMRHRRLVAPAAVKSQLTMEPGLEPIYRRQLKEAGLPSD